MIGELVRREAEIAIAPLTINSAREKVFNPKLSSYMLMIHRYITNSV